MKWLYLVASYRERLNYCRFSGSASCYIFVYILYVTYMYSQADFSESPNLIEFSAHLYYFRPANDSHGCSRLQDKACFRDAYLCSFHSQYSIQQLLATQELVISSHLRVRQFFVNLSAVSGPFESQWGFSFRFFSKPSEPTELENQELMRSS